MSQLIVVAAVALLDGDGRMLTVRKRGTTRFMNPGGKLEPGETPAQAAVRELHEELGLELPIATLVELGTWSASAANEPGATVRAHAFRAPLPSGAVPRPAAEIDEQRWVGLDEVAALVASAPNGVPADYAPLLVQHFLPALRGG
ncbi:NUDIX domain-containing protein [uncultured Jatrophihabitans sp.]|uniref:NUDIX hydrolase n=1 Tax=uncultured Jatrophihabitans sp. TaxID=1610747 RepID=UPI0035CACA03